MTVFQAIQELNGVIINSHRDIYKLCSDTVGSHRRVGPEIDQLINDGKITGGTIKVKGITRLKYEIS